MAETGIELKQLTNWFVNNRKRYWKPRVEAKLQNKDGSSVTSPLNQGTGGLSISIHHMNQVQQEQHGSAGGTSFPSLPNPAESHYAQGNGGNGPASPHLGPVAQGAGVHQVQAAIAAYRDDDPHTISEGSSVSSSDDDSLSAHSTGRRASSVASASQHLDSRSSAGSVGSSSAGGSTSIPVKGGYKRQEEVDVHVLHPEGDTEALPTLRDLTIKSSVPEERILATFKCPISYTIPYEIENDRKKVQSRRDGEVLRVKKHYLKLFLATRGIHSVSSPLGSDNVNMQMPAGPPTSSSATTLTTITEASASTMTTPHTVSPVFTTSLTVATKPPASRSRAFTCTDLGQNDKSNAPARKRARTSSGTLLEGEDEWREICQNAKSVFCDSLPTLEEATRMFGYVSP